MHPLGKMFGGLQPQEVHSAVNLATTNDKLLKLIKEILSLLPGDSRNYLSTDAIEYIYFD